ncbi:MAG: MATE family efflux transporter, partial [Vigna little leaf phytoplasma]|nr:MATE family efflux transporter [Vigna little leaf phytoplasma]
HLGSAIDYYIIGSKVNSTHNIIAAITYLKQIKKILSSIAMALSSAGIVLVTSEYKSKNQTKARQYAALSFLLSLIISIILVLIFYLCTWLPEGFDFCLKKTERSDGGLEYYNLSLLTFIFITINMVFFSLERVKNKTKFILFLNITNILIRIFLSFVCKFFFKETVSLIHLAYADLLANLFISLVAIYFMFFNKRNEFKFQFKELILPKQIAIKMLKLSSILVLGNSSYVIGKHLINNMIIDLYQEQGRMVLAMSGLAAVVNGIFYVISQSFEDAQISMISQNLAIGKHGKPNFKIFKNTLWITFIIGIFGIFLNIFMGQKLLQLIKPDINVNKEELRYFQIVLNFEQFSLFTSIWASLIMGYIFAHTHKANIFLFLNMLRILIRIFLIRFLWWNQKILNIYIQYGLSTLFSNIIILILAIVILFKFVNKMSKVSFFSEK